jgi:NADH-quinone oxidoreductase subunit J
MINVMFFTLAIFALLGSVGMISLKQPIYSALSFIITLLALAGVFALLSAPFLFMVQIIVYAGAILTLLLFIIMFLNIKEEDLPKEENKTLLLIGGAVILIPFNMLIIKVFSTLPSKSLAIANDGFGSLKSFSDTLFNKWLIPFELISFLLLAALVGAVVYARKEKDNG